MFVDILCHLMIVTNLHFILYYQFLRHSAALTRFGNHNTGGFRPNKIFNKLLSSITACFIIGDNSTHLFQSNTYARSEFLHVPSGTNRREGVIRLLAGSNFTLSPTFCGFSWDEA